ncbi:ATP-binding protein [Evtepia gabavorous]|uniref:ATP-binding protein n=1 Tax=Evtepia gabavorous TaxID=2211183 RepID=UPI003A94DE1E
MPKISPLSLEVLTNIFRTSPKDPMRIINREGSTIEFKESYNHSGMAQYFKAIAAFANNNGGYILFGVGDKPRRLLGLTGKSLAQFENIKVEEFTRNLLEYFSPEIKWDHCTFEFRGMSFGVIYVEPLIRKPCICKKSYDDPNPKYTLKEGDIYYRYNGRSERIRYDELFAIIDESRKAEERQWLNFAKQAVRIGVSNAALLDLNSGKLSGSGGSVVLDSSLLSKIAFIREGQFVETGGTPTLRLIGDITEISTGKIVVTETTKKVIRAIDATDIVQAFLENKKVDEPLEYVKRICSASSANYPLYFFLQQAQITIVDALALVKNTTTRSIAKTKLIERLDGRYISQINLPSSKTSPAMKKLEYRQEWLDGKIPDNIPDIQYCVESLLYLTDEEIEIHQQYIRLTLLRIYKNSYENVSPIIASNLRKAICRIDEALYLKN